MLTNNEIQNIKQLIEVCKHTGNYKKLADTAYTLIYNKAIEMGIHLGFDPIQNSQKKPHIQQIIFQYLSHIEKGYHDNFNISIFGRELLMNLNRLETIYHKASQFDNFKLPHIKELFELLFDLDAIQLPNLHKTISKEKIDSLGNMKVFSRLLDNQNPKGRKNNNRTFMAEMINYNLKQKQTQMERKLQQKYNPETVEQLLLLKQVKNSFDASSGKIKVKGTLAESISFRQSFPSLYGYFILGLTLLFFGLGIIIIADGLYSPIVFGALSPFLLLFFGSGSLFLFIYWYLFMRNKGE